MSTPRIAPSGHCSTDRPLARGSPDIPYCSDRARAPHPVARGQTLPPRGCRWIISPTGNLIQRFALRLRGCIRPVPYTHFASPSLSSLARATARCAAAADEKLGNGKGRGYSRGGESLDPPNGEAGAIRVRAEAVAPADSRAARGPPLRRTFWSICTARDGRPPRRGRTAGGASACPRATSA
jgi:hypothetical protein